MICIYITTFEKIKSRFELFRLNINTINYMLKEKVILIGSSGHSKVIIDIFEKEGKYEILGIVDFNRKVGETVLGYSILGADNQLPEIIKSHPGTKVFVAIGHNWLRQKVVNNILSLLPSIEFATAIHPSAQIGKAVSIGHGVAIMAGAIINSDAIIGNFTIINTKASIDHECKMNDFSSLAPNATLGGNVSIGEYTSISISATIIQGITIGANTVIGACALVTKNFGDNIVAYGIPAKIKRERRPEDK